MPKRFTDSDKWRDPWFRRLSPTMKLFWLYLLDNCDKAGIWNVDLDLAQWFIGGKITEKQIREQIDGRVIPIDDGRKWWVPKFISFQYGELKQGHPIHNKILQVLDKYGLNHSGDRVPTECRQGCQTLQEEEEVEEEVQVQEKKRDGFESLWDRYPNKTGKKSAQRHFEATVKTPEDLTNINTALTNYLRSEKVGKGFIKNGSTWFNEWQDWIKPTGYMMGEVYKPPKAERPPAQVVQWETCDKCLRDYVKGTNHKCGGL